MKTWLLNVVFGLVFLGIAIGLGLSTAHLAAILQP